MKTITFDHIPVEIYAVLENAGILSRDILLAARTDRDKEYRLAESYLFLSEKELVVLVGTTGILSQGTKMGYGRPKTEGAFYQKELLRYPIDKLKDLSVEELTSGARIFAEVDGEPCLLATMTGFTKRSAQLFAKYTNLYLRKGSVDFDEEDAAHMMACPECGMRYPDKNRRVCPHCMKRGKLFSRMAKFFLKYKVSLILMLASLVVMTVASTLAPYVSSGFFYDQVLSKTGDFFGQILLVLFLMVGTRLLTALATMVNNYVTSLIAARVVYDLKRTIFGAIERLSLSFFTARQTGGLMTQVNQDATTIYHFFCDAVPYLIVHVVQVAVLLVILFFMNPILAACSLVTVPVFFLLMRWLFRNQTKLHARRYAGSRKLNGMLADVLSGIRVVKAFAREKEEIRKFDDRSSRLADSERTLSVFNNYAWPLTGLVLYLGNIIALGLGGYMVMKGYGGMTYGTLLTFIAYINMIYSPMYFFVQMINRTADCTNAMQRLFEIMDARPEVSEREDPVRLQSVRGEVEFRHVDFSYTRARKVIDDVSFHVKAGQTLGIVGHTGAGKSTLANLLLRLYDTESGDILIDGVSVRDLAFEDLYKNIAIVSQETYLFIGTIFDNIRYARPDATYEEVLEAARLAGCHDFVMRLPDAYATRIGFGYQDLSGGERQRVSIARAILRQPKILVLDEATAAMDTETERRIQTALSQLTKNKTTIMIAHRLSTLRDADHLIVIEDGRVAESGTQESLLAKKGVYHRLYTLQEEALKNAGILE